MVLHESDAVMGLSNRILSKLSQNILCAFPKEKEESFPTPVRNEFFGDNSKKGNYFLKRSGDRPLLLVFGGSQGAQIINEWIFEKARVFSKIADIVVITGKGKLPKKKDVLDFLHAVEFLDEEFSWILSAASVVVSRAGASTIAELSATGKCAVLVPLSTAANGEQEENAKILKKRNAALLLHEKDLLTSETQKLISELLLFPENRIQYEKNIREFSDPQASQKIVSFLNTFFSSR